MIKISKQLGYSMSALFFGIILFLSITGSLSSILGIKNPFFDVFIASISAMTLFANLSFLTNPGKS